MSSDVLCLPTPSALYAEGARLFVSAALDAVNARGVFSVALSGGSTPKGVYSLLADDPSLRSQVPWDRVQFFWGDERHVGPDHQDSNYRMAHDAMLTRLPIDPERVWRIRGECASAESAAREYERDLRMMLGAGGLPRLDLVLLGLGPDGHTASLFPCTRALHERERLVAANWVAKLNAFRITLTPPILNNAADVLFLIHGADKADALRGVLEGPPDPDRLPAQLVRPTNGHLRWLVDRCAAQSLSTYRASELPL